MMSPKIPPLSYRMILTIGVKLRCQVLNSALRAWQAPHKATLQRGQGVNICSLLSGSIRSPMHDFSRVVFSNCASELVSFFFFQFEQGFEVSQILTQYLWQYIQKVLDKYLFPVILSSLTGRPRSCVYVHMTQFLRFCCLDS